MVLLLLLVLLLLVRLRLRLRLLVLVLVLMTAYCIRAHLLTPFDYLNHHAASPSPAVYCANAKAPCAKYSLAAMASAYLRRGRRFRGLRLRGLLILKVSEMREK